MKAIVFHGIGDIRPHDVKEPKIKDDGDAIIRLSYGIFIGTIPGGSYGAGEVFIWDQGIFENIDSSRTIVEGLDDGKLIFASRP